MAGMNSHKSSQNLTKCASVRTNTHTPLLEGVRLCVSVKKLLIAALPLRLIRTFAPGYLLAAEKREFETYLRAQGWTRREALAAVAKKYSNKEGTP